MMRKILQNAAAGAATALLLLGCSWPVVVLADDPQGYVVGIPSIPYTASSSASLALSAIREIVVDPRYEDAVDSRGETLIPPTLRQFATTFAQDLTSASPGARVIVRTGRGCAPTSSCVLMTLADDPGAFQDAAGRETSEGYALRVNAEAKTVTISGASPLGAWWATRTVLQLAALNGGRLPHGGTSDSPGWGVRGMMLDAGRHFYPKEFLIEMCAYMSFFKQNTFHLHLSDNLYNNPAYSTRESLNLYARFRLYSDSPRVAGLNRFANESYSRRDFDEIQAACAARGVTIVPELEAPGHSLVITQWKPAVGRSDDLSLLNISHPDAIPAVQAIWAEFLPWMHTKTVSIGADEYTGATTDYNHFVNEMDAFIGRTSNKSMRIWGTFPPRFTGADTDDLNVSQNVSIQHWAYFECDPYSDFIQNNYSVVNSMDDFYIVNKYGGYPNAIKHARIFHGSPDGGPWYPFIFHESSAERNPPASSPFVLGSIVPLWNDYGPNATVYSEAYYAWRRSLPALADKQWGGNLTEPQFDHAFDVLHALAPAQNLDRTIPSASETIINYTLSEPSTSAGPDGSAVVRDSSGNGYDAHTDCPSTENRTLAVSPSCALTSPLSSKGRDYTLTMRVLLSALSNPSNATLISGRDSSLMLTPNLTLFASGNYYAVPIRLPMNTWVDIAVSGIGNRTYASLTPRGSGDESGTTEKAEFQTMMGINGVSVHYAEIAIEAPLKQVGGAGCGWTGELLSLTLTSS